jgi:hypothetical protein
MNKYFFMIIIVLLAVFHGAAQKHYLARISGTVVNEKDGAVKAAITFDIPQGLQEKDCWAKDTTVVTDSEGRFVLEEHCTLKNREISLFIMPTTGLDFLQLPVRPPYWTGLQESDSKFAGIKVRLEGNQHVDIGKVRVPIKFGRMELFVLRRDGLPLYKTRDEWSRFILVVRDEKGNAVGDQALSIRDIESSVKPERGALMLALPEGIWTLELLNDWNDLGKGGETLRYLARTTVRIDNDVNTTTATLSVR